MEWIASLPMYDEPEVRASSDALFDAIARALQKEGLAGVPQRLTRDLSPEQSWRHPRLLLGQACGYPLVTSLRETVRVVGAPVHDVAGWEPGSYASALVVCDRGAPRTLEDLRGARCALNSHASHSGMNALRALIAPLAREARFFGELHVSGSHRASLALLRRGIADVAAIDCVTLGLIGRVAPGELAGLGVLCHTAPAPALPFVTAMKGSDARLPALRAALRSVLSNPALRKAREPFAISGFVDRDDHHYAPITEMSNRARALGYPELR